MRMMGGGEKKKASVFALIIWCVCVCEIELKKKGRKRRKPPK